jgi:uncharacterized DUF497 family protein
VFEWDERKRRRNLADRGVDFFDVLSVFEAPQRLEFEDIRKDYGERRHVILCPVEGRLFHVTYTMRGSNRRIISARKANRREQRIYERHRDAHAGGSHN